MNSFLILVSLDKVTESQNYASKDHAGDKLDSKVSLSPAAVGILCLSQPVERKYMCLMAHPRTESSPSYPAKV